jgi:O-antigen ligase
MNSSEARISPVATSTTPGLNLYLLFVISWFVHFPARLEFLGTIRLDLILVCILAGLALTRASRDEPPARAGKVLRLLIVYAIVMIPFVYWPGSAIKSGLPNFIKAAVFFYFTVAFVRTEADLKKFVLIFLSCQIFRIVEPLYLNLTQDYWGAGTSMGNWERMLRLSGAPSDIINPNGLAFVVCTVLPFLYFMSGLSSKYFFIALMLAPACLYVLSLTGSRSGIIGLAALMLSVVVKSKSRASIFLIATIGLVVVGVGFTFLAPDLQDRYLSIIGKGEKNAVTVEERMEGMEAQLEVVMNRPMLGYGLGTSAEANAHFTTSGPYQGMELPAHNLYLEIAQELGVGGLIIFLFFIKEIFSGFAMSKKLSARHDPGGFLARMVDAMQVWLVMNVVFSFASYGLSSYEWYLFGGLSVVLQRIAGREAAEELQVKDSVAG